MMAVKLFKTRRGRIASFVAMLFLLAGSLISPAPGADISGLSPEELYLMATEAEDAGDYRRAASLYQGIGNYRPVDGREEIMASSLFSLYLLQKDRFSKPELARETLQSIIGSFPGTSWADRAREIFSRQPSARNSRSSGGFSSDALGGMGFSNLKDTTREKKTSNSSTESSATAPSGYRTLGKREFRISLPSENWKAIPSLEGIPAPPGLETIFFDTAAAAAGITPVPNLLVLHRETRAQDIDGVIQDNAADLGVTTPGANILTRQEIPTASGKGVHLVMSVLLDGVALKQEWLILLRREECWLLGLTCPQSVSSDQPIDSRSLFSSFALR